MFYFGHSVACVQQYIVFVCRMSPIILESIINNNDSSIIIIIGIILLFIMP